MVKGKFKELLVVGKVVSDNQAHGISQIMYRQVGVISHVVEGTIHK